MFVRRSRNGYPHLYSTVLTRTELSVRAVNLWSLVYADLLLFILFCAVGWPNCYVYTC
ncbi:unnamed protein product [Chondrus crispus]|uniref:Uncharacterized protein n=1 Tax=Chondrus crispus TaxID=2769 RepID=R7QAR4_CHOCR|nr:unnamed protein product [Chondrus crispus]CDF34545.1 unnamed protein product [Chondrus crispus]|eukprot:XP_005714364.1 unnamed protein product [Chondrus crispus]